MNVEQENELLRKNIKDLQGQLRNANIKIKNLTDDQEDSKTFTPL